MNRVLKVVVVLLVLGFAFMLAAAGLGRESAANADIAYSLYIINNPDDVSAYQYSVNGTDYEDVTLPLSDFVSGFYSALPDGEALYLYIGTADTPLVTPESIPVYKDTIARNISRKHLCVHRCPRRIQPRYRNRFNERR